MVFVAKSRMERAEFYLLNSDKDRTTIVFDVGIIANKIFAMPLKHSFK